MKLRIKKLDSRAIIPKYATSGSACFDLHAIEPSEVGAHSAASFRTGLAFEIPPGHMMLIYSRSGHGFKHGLRLCNSVGVIDSDYRHEVAVKLQNDTPLMYAFEAGDRIAQAMVVPVDQVEFIESDTLSSTDRNGGFGSTGNGISQ